MTFRLRSIEFMANGRKLVRDHDIDKSELTVGRAADNDVHLPDLGVDPYHARIVAQTDSLVAVESLSGLGFSRDGKTVQSAQIDCRTGAELAFGFYRVTLGQDADGTLLVEVQNSAGGSEHEDPVEQKRAFALSRVMLGKRSIGWALAAIILALFLVWPVSSHLAHADQRAGKVTGDRAWNAGPLSLAHHQLTDNCEACHTKAFKAVSDTTCQSCHQNVHDHAAPARLAAAMGRPDMGGAILQKIGQTFGQPGPGSCQGCHVEHLGAGPMQPARQKFCSDCHADLDRRLPDTKIRDAGDFARLHPQFTATVVGNPETRQLTRISLDGHPREDNGLTFEHGVHLDPRGGVTKMALTLAGQGYGKALTCANCHHASEDGVRFQKTTMERDCQTCHSLAYDRVGGTVRTLRHGSVDQMIADLTAAGIHRPAPVAGAGIGGRMRPGEFASGGLYRASFQPAIGLDGTSGGMPKGGLVAQAMSKNGVCGQCHTPEMRRGKLDVKPVTLVTRYMQRGWFDHSAHSQEACSDCHAAKTSNSSTDLLLPGIKTCQNCHVGEEANATLTSAVKTGAKIPSSCAMCHVYHMAPGESPRAHVGPQPTTGSVAWSGPLGSTRTGRSG